MLGYDDKRNFYRMMVNSPCQVVLVDNPSNEEKTAVCRDISATGMSLEMDGNVIEEGALLEITIDSNNEQIPSLVAKAKVIRCDELGESSILVGVEISEMNKQSRYIGPKFDINACLLWSNQV
jgi:c-di-GMP-binding flagellar brake protein YcgR